MAGICAVLGPDANIQIKKICEKLRHRGPDDEGYYFDKMVALGHRALKLGNSPVSQQPLTNEDRTIWITFDGEIYNKGHLIDQLEKNHTFETNSSAEVVVHEYEEYGPDCVDHFNGLFAFCLWDSNKRTLFSARDKHGSKPLYYCKTPNQFLVSSEIKGLLSIASVPREPNDSKIYDYLMGASHNPDETFFLGIRSLLAGHYLLADKDSTTAYSYWNPIKPHRVKESQEYISEFLELFQDSVNIRLPEGLPFATFLSGGIDSPSVACVIDAILKQTPSEHTSDRHLQEFFSAVYENSLDQGDERPYIEEVLNTLGAKTTYVFPSVTGRWTDIQHFIYAIDEPVLVLNNYVFWCLSREASKKVHVAFYGMTGRAIGGGMDTASSYIRFLKQLLRKKRIDRLIVEFIGMLPRFSMNTISKIKTTLIRNENSRIKRLLDPRFVVRVSNRKQEAASLYSDYLIFRDSLDEHLRVCDRVSSAFSIEPRYPFLDHRITEFFLDPPTEQKVRYGLTKYVIRSAMKGLLPEAVRKTRKKFGTPIPIERWMKELRKNIEKVFASEKFRERGYFDQVAVSNLFDRCCDLKIGRADRQYYWEVLWRILNLELWFEIFFDQEADTSS